MHLLHARAAFALLAGSFAIATACGSDRKFPSREGGGAEGGEAGDSEATAGNANHAGSGGASHAGAANGGEGNMGGSADQAGAGGEAGTGATNGEGGASGEPGIPACGSPAQPCCASDMCVANAACTTGSCACATNYTACTDACVDLKGDARNCGACGHSCLGGTCDLGSCQPKTIATGQSRLTRMATDGTYLYWSGALTGTADYYVSRARVDGTGTVKVIASGEQGAGALAVTSDKVYWLAKGQLRSCDMPDCTTGAQNAATATSNGVSGDILYEPGKKALYWSRGATYNTKDGTLYRLASGSTTPTVIGTNPSNPGALVSDSGNVYWINSSTYTTDNLNADGGLWRVRTSDDTTTQLASSMKGDISYLAIGGSGLFFAGNIQITGSSPVMFTGAILRAPLPNGFGTGPQPKFADAKNVRGMEADDKYLYFADESGSQGTISRCPIAACPTPETIVPGLYQPNLGAQDATSIYFAASSSSATTTFTIQRLAK